MDVVCGLWGRGGESSARAEQTKRNLSQQGWPSQAAIDGMVLKDVYVNQSAGPMGFLGVGEGHVSHHLLLALN